MMAYRAAALSACLLLLPGAMAVDHGVQWAFGTAIPQVSAAAGDTMTFNFGSGHNVVPVPSGVAWPASCSAAKGNEIGSSGPITVTLSTAGTFTYVCTIGSHCSSGKMSVTVVVSGAAAVPSPSPSPPPSRVSGSKDYPIPWSWMAVKPNTINISVGDALVFTFATGAHNVAQLAAAGTKWPDSCSAPLLIKAGYPVTNGPATIIMDKPGSFSFICTFASHCASGGMHIDVLVAPPITKSMPPPLKSMSPPPKKGVPPPKVTAKKPPPKKKSSG